MVHEDNERFIQEFRDKYFLFFPKKATELGNHDHDGALGKWGREGVRERITFLQHYRDLIKDSLEIDALVLKNIIDSNLFHLKVVKPYTRPDFFAGYALDSIDRLIHLLQQAALSENPDPEGLEKVVDSLVSRVNEFPVLFEQSKEWLFRTTPVSRNLTLHVLDFFQSFLETDYRSFVKSLDIPSHLTEKLLGVIPFTINSLSRFAGFVKTLEVIPLDHASLKRPKNFLNNLFRRKYNLEYDARDLLNIARDSICRLTQCMEAIAGGDIARFYERLIERNLIPYSRNGINDHLMRYVREKSEEYFDFCRRTAFAPADRMPLIEWTPTYRRRNSPLASYIPCGPYESVRNSGVLWVCPAPSPMAKKDFFSRKYLYHHQMINSLIIHELVGHHLQFDRLGAIDRDAVKISSNLTTDEGFALYMEDVFTEEYAKTLSSPQEAADMIFFQKKAELMRAHRLYLDVSLTTGRITLEEAVRYFSEQNSMPLETAQAECEKYYLNPGVASSYMIGKLELTQLKERLEKKFGQTFSLHLFHQGLVNYGAIPIPLIQRSMIEKLFKSEKVIY